MAVLAAPVARCIDGIIVYIEHRGRSCSASVLDLRGQPDIIGVVGGILGSSACCTGRCWKAQRQATPQARWGCADQSKRAAICLVKRQRTSPRISAIIFCIGS
jgi:hypothetical protein